jgi:hypothetical protein
MKKITRTCWNVGGDPRKGRINMKYLLVFLIVVLSLSVIGCEKKKEKKEEEQSYKPIIYLYPEEVMEVSVKFADLDDVDLTHTYPEYGEEGWNVVAHPDGTLFDIETGEEYYALYWEGYTERESLYDTGFVVEGFETANFLDEVLEDLGLTRREVNEFVVYWLPILEISDYNFLHFSTVEWNETLPLDINPAPDTLIRVMMRYRPLDSFTSVDPQSFDTPKRIGFTVVEWGGGRI